MPSALETSTHNNPQRTLTITINDNYYCYPIVPSCGLRHQTLSDLLSAVRTQAVTPEPMHLTPPLPPSLAHL